MIASDFAVQIKLIIMYSIGILVGLALLGYLVYKYKRPLTKFTVPLMIIELVMIYLLITVIKLS